MRATQRSITIHPDARGAEEFRTEPQCEAEASYTRMLDKRMCPIDWSKSPREIVKWICGLQPWPVATMELEGKTYRVFGAEYSASCTDKAPGTVISAGEKGMIL